MTDGRINIDSTALIIADFYKDMMGTIAHSIERNVLSNTQELQKAARQSGMLICYSATVFRPGYIETRLSVSERTPDNPRYLIRLK